MSLNMIFLGYGGSDTERFLINPMTVLGFWLKEDKSIGIDNVPINSADA